MSLHLIIGDKLLSSWSLRGALALDLTGAAYTEELIKLGQPDTRERLLKHSPTGKVPLLKTEHGTIADSLAIAEYLAEQFPDAGLWPKDTAARAQARSACAQMHAGFFAMRGNMPFDLSRDAPLSPMPADVQADIERMLALWAECRAAATETGPYLFGRVDPGRCVLRADCRTPAHLSGEIAGSGRSLRRNRSTNGRPSRPGRRPDWRSGQ